MARAKPSNFTGAFGDINAYNAFSLRKNYTVKELRAEYRAMRREAKDRIKQLKQSEFANAQVLEGKEYLNADPSRMTKRELAANMGYTAGFLNSDLSTVEGQANYRENVIQTFRDMGFNQINDKNFKEFDAFMKASSVYIKNKIIRSDVILEMFETAKERNISVANMKKNMLWYYNNLERIQDTSFNSNRKRKYTMRELERIFNK